VEADFLFLSDMYVHKFVIIAMVAVAAMVAVVVLLRLGWIYCILTHESPKAMPGTLKLAAFPS
jgi:hypothetical protein